MDWGINLRADLARLSDGDLAAEFDHMIEYRLARFGTAPPVAILVSIGTVPPPIEYAEASQKFIVRNVHFWTEEKYLDIKLEGDCKPPVISAN